MSRLVDKAFLGISFKRPTYKDRKTTGIFLLPFTFALDVATFPIQALLVVILGDEFPFSDTQTAFTALAMSPQFEQLDADKQAVATAELETLILSGQVTSNTALALGEDGHWTLVTVSDEARNQLLVRAQSLGENAGAVCLR
jgi:hypothetical protein